MPDLRTLFILALIVAADTAWLYPLLSLIGFLVDRSDSLLPMPLIPLVIVSGGVVARLAVKLVPDPRHYPAFQALLGLVAVYLAISAVPASAGIDLLWGPRLLGGGFSGAVSIGLVLGCVAAGLLWYRGVRIANETKPPHRLTRTFRTGIVALAILILLEQAYGADFAAADMLIPFFVVTLGGLAYSRSPGGGIWTRVTGLTVAFVVLGGLLLGLVGMVLGGRGLALLAIAWDYVLDGLNWLISTVVTPVLNFLFGWIAWLETSPDNFGLDIQRPSFDWRNLVEPEEVSPFVEFMALIIKYPLLLLAVYLLYRLLRWAYEAQVSRAAISTELDRESIRENADSTADLIRLALELLPDWLIGGAGEQEPRFPRDRPGITEVYELYFDMLAAARRRGHVFVPSATPSERRAEMEALLPDAPVSRITERFNAACYGNIAADSETIGRLRSALESALAAR